MTKKELKTLILSDAFRYDGRTDNYITKLIRNSGFKYTRVLRKCQYYRQSKANILQYLFCRMLLNRYMYKYGYEIPYTVNIGEGFFINHIGGIVINGKVVLGKNVNITKGITIGQTNRGSKKGIPVIGNKVWIGANATIVGKIKVGDNVLIAPNAYVNFDVPDNSIVLGNPGKIIHRDDATEGYINNIV